MIRIVRVKPEGINLGRLCDLERLTFPWDDPYPKRDGAAWWLGFGSPVGRSNVPCAWAGARDLGTGQVYLCRAGVRPEVRGWGIQGRLIRVRERYARTRGAQELITDTTQDNLPSANSLIRAGFRLYEPGWRWAGADRLYWRKVLTG